MKRMTAGLLIGMAIFSICGTAAAGTDKTLVSWVCLANTTQQGGSALTIQRGDQFDGIVFGEKQAGRWMAGSDFFKRTQGDQQANIVEKADDKTLVQMAIVYQGKQISIYRNGEPYAAYEANNIDLLGAKGNIAVFGLRHVGTETGNNLQGSIEDARIFDSALTADEIKKLQPNQPSEIKPYAWWTFEKGKDTDLMGRFPINNLDGGAKIEGGRLVLETGTAALIAATRKITGDSDIENETPAMPANPPDDWLTYHLFHPGPGGAMPGDPNCAFYWKGRYHLHYIYDTGKGPSFAHVSSTDMVHWTWHPTTLAPKTTGHGMYSGTGFITKDGKPAIIYHGLGSGRNQLAFALDDNFEQWTRPVPIIPRDASGGQPQFHNCDPDCWLIGDTYYAISGGGNPSLMKSSDLKDWLFLGPLLHDAYPANIGMPKGEDISCANMFKIGNKWMLLCISHRLGCRYYLGNFKDEKYLPEFQAMMSWNGNDWKTPCFFAPESVLAKDGRRVMWAWLLNEPVASCGIQSLPRELELPEDGVLRIKPLRELQSLRYDKKQKEGIAVKSDAAYPIKEISGNTLELEVVFKSPAAKEFGLDMLCDKNGENGLRVAVMAESKTLRVGNVRAPFVLKEGEDLTLRVFIDKNLVEVFANDRQAAVAATGKYVPENLGVRLFSSGGDVVVKQLKCWKMKSIYTASQVPRAEAGPPADERRTGYVHDTSINPFIVTGDDKELGDPMPVYWDGMWHLYALDADGFRTVPHFTSTDLVKWVEHKPAMVGKDICTGTVVRHENKYYLFYTDAGPQTIRLVVSDNPWEFDFSKSRLVAEADGSTYRKDTGFFRDAYVFYNEEEMLWWMLIEGRCPEVCTGLLKSKDLLQWTRCEPIFKDKARTYGSCPQIFKQGRLWYLACQDWYNWHYTAENPCGSWTNRGPYLSVAIEAASRFATDGKRQITWGWLANFEQTNKTPGPANIYPPTMRLLNYGGPLCIGREMVFKKDGTMGVRPFPELLAAIRKKESKVDLFGCARKLSGEWKIEAAQRTLQCMGESGGTVLLDLPEKNPNYYFEAELEFDSPRTSASIVLRSSDNADRGYSFALIPAEKKIAIREFNYRSDGKVFNDKEYAFPGKSRVSLQIFICDNNMEVFVDGQECLSARTIDRTCHKAAIEITGGAATVSKPLLHYFKN